MNNTGQVENAPNCRKDTAMTEIQFKLQPQAFVNASIHKQFNAVANAFTAINNTSRYNTIERLNG
jgi:hypothetical protein